MTAPLSVNRLHVYCVLLLVLLTAFPQNPRMPLTRRQTIREIFRRLTADYCQSVFLQVLSLLKPSERHSGSVPGEKYCGNSTRKGHRKKQALVRAPGTGAKETGGMRTDRSPNHHYLALILPLAYSSFCPCHLHFYAPNAGPEILY